MGVRVPPLAPQCREVTTEILIDGYNVIGIFHRDLDRVRKQFIQDLIKYRQIKGHSITVVFDAYKGTSLQEQIKHEGGIRVIYTSAGKKADELILEILRTQKKHYVVVSSDRQISDFAWSRGCIPIKSETFLDRLEAALQGIPQKTTPSWTSTPKGKGTSRRLSKKQKAIMRVLNKL